MANSSSKGHGFEREVAKRISQWISGNKDTPYLIYRTSNSGATFTVNSRKGKGHESMTGDLTAIDESAKFFTDKISIECKTGYKTANIFSTFKGAKNDILRGFWEQATSDANKVGKEPMLVFKPLGNKWLMGLTENFAGQFFPEMFLNKTRVHIKFNNELPILILFPFEDFFTYYKPEHLIERFSK